MNPIEKISEQRILEAIRRGEFDNLPGAGRPLRLEDDDPFVPAELKMAYKILKNAGCLPPEVEARKEIAHLSQLMPTMTDGEERRQAGRRLNYLMLRLGLMRRCDLRVEGDYYTKLVNKLG